MRSILIGAVLIAQTLPLAAPARAAELVAEPRQSETRMGAFAGARVRVALGETRGTRLRAGVTIAPALHRVDGSASRLRVGEGLEYGISDRKPAGVSLAGYRISDVQRSPDGRRHNVSTLGWVAIGAGVVVLAGVAVLGWLVHEANENSE